MKKYLAQQLTVGGFQINGPLQGINNLGDLINRAVADLLIPLAGVILLIVLIWGGLDYMTSQGNPEKLKGAQAKISTGIIGFVLLIISYIVVKRKAGIGILEII